MSDTARDTQFAGFAKLVVDELLANSCVEVIDSVADLWEQIIAQRAYDLVDHTVGWISPMDFECQAEPYQAIVKATPDLIELPQVSE